jgi:hypothetical protein
VSDPRPHAPRDEVLRRLLERHAAPPGAAPEGPCPDPGQLVGLAEGRLLSHERDRVIAHVERCAACLELVGEWAVPSAVPVPAARSGPPLWSVALAASLLVGVGIALAVARGLAGARRHGDPDHALVAAAAELVRDAPEELAGFAPLARAERLSQEQRRERGGMRLLAPRGKVLAGRPVFRWEPVAGAEVYRVSVRAEDGRPVIERVEVAGATSFEWPSDVPPPRPGAAYAYDVEADTPIAHHKTGLFRVATAQEQAALEAQLEVIDRRAPRDLRAVLRAHLALRRGEYYGLAEAETRAVLKDRPDDSVARETLFWILRKLGASEAESLGVDARPAR